MRSFFIAIIFFSIAAFSCVAQPYIFEKISAKNGLPSNSVSGIAIDPNGYLWIGSIMGLYRYDGYNFLTTNRQGRNKTISIDKYGNLFGQDEQAFFSLNTKTKQENTIFPLNTSDADPNNDQYNNLFVDIDNNVWSCDYQYIKRYVQKDKKLELYKIFPEKGYYEFAKFADDGQGNIWIGTTNGLLKFNKKKRTITVIAKDIFVKAIILQNNKIVLGSTNGKILEYDIAAKKISEIGKLKFNDDISFIAHAWGQKYWITTYNRLFLFDLEQKIFQEMEDVSKEGYVFAGIQKDEKNKIFWFATNAGLLKLNFNEKGIKNVKLPADKVNFPVKIHSFLETKKGLFCLGLAHSGLLLYNEKLSTFQKINAADDVVIKKVIESENGEIYCASNKGVYKVVGDRLQQIVATKNAVNSITIDYKNRLWVIPYQSELMVFQLPAFKAVKPWKSTPYPDFFQTNVFNEVFENTDHRLWFAAWFPKGFGICYLDENKQKFVEISDFNDRKLFVADYYISISKVVGANDLVFSAYGGSNKINAQGKIIEQLRTYDKKELAFIPHFDHSIEDANANQWFGTSEGLYLVNKKTKRVSRFTEFDGISSNNTMTGFSLTKNGTLLIGQNNEFAMIDTKKILDNQKSLQLKLSNVKILGNPKKVNPDDGLFFERNENSLSFDFTTLSYNSASQNFYKYRFNENTEWIDNGNSNNITFANLPFGEYNLQVKVGDNIGNWIKTPMIIPFEIKSVFYETNLFKSFLVLLFLAAVYLFYRYRIAQITQMHKIRSRISSDIHDEIGSTMSGISIIGTLLKEKFGGDLKSKKLAERLVEDSKLVSNTLDDIIWSVKPQNDKLIDLSSRMNRFASDLFEGKGIEYSINIPDDGIKLSLKMDLRYDFYLIFKEAVNNLVKYSNCTKAKVDMVVDKKTLILTIKDNGKGFDTTKISTKNGISNMKNRAEKLKGTFEIKSVVGVGTEIQVFLPL